jgi:hypothetical protein
MWLIFGGKTRCRPVEGGWKMKRFCDGCEKVQTLVECDVKDSFTVFFVSVGGMETRRMVCRECGEDYDLPAAAEPAQRAAPPTARPAPPKQPDKKKQPDLDEMLAELKRKL